MPRNVPKPSDEFATENADAKQEPLVSECVPKPDDFGTPETHMAAAAVIAESVGQEIATKFRTFAPRQKRSIVSTFRRQLFPPRKPGRKRSKEISAALADWQIGTRGLALYRKHIPRFQRMSIWERKVKTRALMDAIRARKRRELRRETPAVESPENQIPTWGE